MPFSDFYDMSTYTPIFQRSVSRRQCVKWAGIFSLISLISGKSATARENGSSFYLPPEWAEHQQAVMALCNADKLYGGKWAEQVRKDQILIASELSRYEEVVMLVSSEQMLDAKSRVPKEIILQESSHFDIWTRDTLPIFVEVAGRVEGIGLNFNVWGNKFLGFADYAKDRELAESFCKERGIDFRRSGLVTEGGAIDTNGEGTLLTTRQSLLNKNRNPGMSEREVTDALMYITGSEQVIWLDGGGEENITDGHIDGIARFVDSSTVIAEYVDEKSDPAYTQLKENIAVLEKSRNLDGKQLSVAQLARPRYDKMRYHSWDFAANYVNFYIANGAVLMPEFGDDVRDADALSMVESLFPSRSVFMLNVDGICKGGGGIHCSLMQIPLV